MKKLNITAILCCLIFCIASCGPSSNKTDDGSTTAKSVAEVETTAKSVAEGEVAIGNQIWISKNLNVNTYRNGDVIPEVQDQEAWENLTTGAWCYYENNTANSTTYGKLYNWYAVNDPRGLAPNGYHIPSDDEWMILTTYLGGKLVAGTKMKSTTGWKNNGNGTNTSGFSGLPGGCRFLTGHFGTIDSYGNWWSSSEDDAIEAWDRSLNSNYVYVYRNASHKLYGFSVRCIRD